MEWDVVFDESRGAVVVTTRGTFDQADHGRMVADIVGREGWRPGRRILFDHRGLDFGDAGFRQMFAAGGHHRAHDARIGNARSALLMGSVADFGMGRQFQHIIDGTGAELGVFINESEAWGWLLAEPDAL